MGLETHNLQPGKLAGVDAKKDKEKMTVYEFGPSLPNLL